MINQIKQTTANNIKFTFDNNILVNTCINDIFIFDEKGNLIEVNFTGYKIEKL